MKMKQKSFKKMLSIFIALIIFTFVGAVNLEAKSVVTIKTEQELKEALAKKYTEETTIKLDANITVSDYLDVYLNDKPLTFDLAGYKLEIPNNNFVINFGSDLSNSYDTGTFTFTDSSSTGQGQLIVYQNIVVHSLNTQSANETPKTYNFTIDGGNYSQKVATGTSLIELFCYDSYDYGRSITASIKIKKGTFTSYTNLLAVPSADKDIKMNFMFDTLTYYNSGDCRLGANRFTDIKFEEVVPNDSKIYNLKNGIETEITSRTGFVYDLTTGTASGAYIKIIKDEGFNVDNVTLDDLTYGYTSTGTKGISIYNRGQSNLQVKSVTSSDSNFIVEGSGTPTINVGATNTDFKIKAKDGLSVGTYTTTITVTDINDKTYTSTATVKVNQKPITGHSIASNNWIYGTSGNEPNITGLSDLNATDYEVTYAKKDSTEFSTTKPTKAGDYIVKLHVTNENYAAEDVTDEFTINKNTLLEIKTNSKSWQYDGSDHSDLGYEIYYNSNKVSSGSGNVTLSTGDKINVTVTGSVKDVDDTSEHNNAATYTLENGDCYDVKVTYGTLTITPITTPIVVTTGSATRGYNGEKLTNGTYSYTEGVLLTGDILTADITGEQRYVGTSNNTVGSVTIKRGEKDITSNYTFGTHQLGSLQVEAASQNVSLNENVYVKVDGTLSIEQIKEKLNCNLNDYNIEYVSGSAGSFDATSGFTAGSNEGQVTMNVVAPAIDINGDGEPEYKETSTSFTINVVNKELVTISGLNDNEVFTYDGSSKQPSGSISISNESVSLSDLDIKYTGAGYDNKNAPTNAGSYTVTYKVKDSNADYTGSVSYNFTIKKAQLEKVTLSNNSFEYTGSNITPTINNTNDNIVISGNTTSLSVNNYQIVAKLKDTNNYEWTDGSSDDITLNWYIVQATPAYTIPDNLTSIKDKTLNDVTLPDGFTWNYLDTVLTAGNNSYKATFTPNDIVNYKTISDIDIQVLVKDLFNLTTSVNGSNGSISTSKANIVEGSEEEVIFTPDTGYMIDKVLVNDTPTTVTDNKLKLTMNENKVVRVSYKKIPFTITIKDVTGATITPNDNVTVNYGDNQEFTIVAKSGYKLTKVLVNGTNKISNMVGNKLTLINIKSNINLEAVVEKLPTPSTNTDKSDSSTTNKSYSSKDKNHDGIVTCQEEMDSPNWVWSTSKNACVYKVSNTSAK